MSVQPTPEKLVQPIFDKIKELGFKEIDGDPSYRSQCMITYATWRNGRIMPEGSESMQYTKHEPLVNAAVQFFVDAHAKGNRRIVWRKRPVITIKTDRRYRNPVTYSLRFRLHF